MLRDYPVHPSARERRATAAKTVQSTPLPEQFRLCISNNDPYNTQMRFSCDKVLVISKTTCQEFSIGCNRGLAEQKEVQAPGTILSNTEEVHKLTNLK